MKTYVAIEKDVPKKWYVVDAKDKVLGRLATQIATVLKGKHKPIYSPHMDTGDFVIVVNAAKVQITGEKATQKRYFRHSGYPGGLREQSFEQMRAKFPERVVEQAVRGMLPRNRLGRQMLRKLKVYGGPQHPHSAQSPKPMAIDARKVS